MVSNEAFYGKEIFFNTLIIWCVCSIGTYGCNFPINEIIPTKKNVIIKFSGSTHFIKIVKQNIKYSVIKLFGRIFGAHKN